MSAWIATTLAFAITVIAAGMPASAGCVSRGSGQCVETIDLNSVSEIAGKIVGEEPSGKKQSAPVAQPAVPTTYTGPIFGAAPGKRTPTVGYSWSLE